MDRQMTGLAGEWFVAAELLKRGLQTSITFGNAKQIDLLAHNSQTGKNFSIQVKALRTTNYFDITPANVRAQHVYVFVLLNNPGEAVQYFVVPGSVLAEQPERFGEVFQHPTRPGIHPRSLAEFAENCTHFES